MALIIEWNEEQRHTWDEWVASRPSVIREMCEKFPPNRLYQLKSTNQRVTLHSYSTDGTMTVNVTGEYNAVIFERQVFGIRPDDLVECDLPQSTDPLGALLTD
jgi:hypothetical protein